MTLDLWTSLLVSELLVLIPSSSAVYLETTAMLFGRQSAIATTPGLTIRALLAMLARPAVMQHAAASLQAIMPAFKGPDALALDCLVWET
ncbi:MAG: hypothetical protein QNJ09_11775 [Paracoccaceae bacterium]|nr:hypothetical protein [Paracoccaceae bacterium]